MWLPLLLGLGSALAFEDCKDYMSSKCAGDPYSEVIAFNVGSQELCQAHCELFENCQFYSFHILPTQGVDCHLYDEPFTAYVNHCKEVGGPAKGSSDLHGPCFSPDPDSCEIQQYGDCNMFGQVEEEVDSVTDKFKCEQFCSLNKVCQYWTYNTETQSCKLFNDDGKKCNVAFGPHSGSPFECGSDPDDITTNRPPDPTVDPDCGVTCPSEGLALFEDCHSCGRFYECFNGALTQRTCPYCNHFDPRSGFCNQPPTVDCGSRPVPDPDDCHECEQEPPCLCPMGYFPDPWDCDTYVYCSDSKHTDYSCSNGTFSGLYNDKKIQCDFPERVQCENRPICRGDSYTKCQCQGAKEAEPATCAGTSGVIIVEDPYNCQHFLVCVNGNMMQEVFCAAGQYLPPGGQECVAGDGSVCGGRPVCEDIQATKKCTCV